MEVLPYEACPTCNHTAVELLPLSNCEQYRFEYTATRGVASRHIVNFINYGNYDKRTGLITAHLEESRTKGAYLKQNRNLQS